MSSDNFYAHLPAFEDFKGIANETNYAAPPGDWWIFVADVTNSTVAVNEGRYKDVNTVGAAAIVVAHEVMGEQAFPFVFGGDGATMLVPPSCADALGCALTGLKDLAKTRFGLDLRIGKIEVSSITEMGACVRVAKMSLVANKSIAIFSGGGLSMAERLIKSRADDYAVTGPARANDLNRLSCRWQPVPSRHGRMVSLVISARDSGGMDVIADFIEFLDGVYEGDLSQSNPISIDHMSYSTVRQCLVHETRLHQTAWSKRFFSRFTQILIAVWAFRLKLPPVLFDAKAYCASLNTHSDYRKYDDTLKMTIDCSADQLAQIEAYLAMQHAAGKLFYGMHDAQHALMTCFVDGLGEGRHIHFIDGADGGYFSASVQHKKLTQLNTDAGFASKGTASMAQL